MIKIDIVKRIAQALEIKDREALTMVDTIIESMKDTINDHQRLEIRNFGVFQVKQRKPRTGRNPRNKREYPIMSRKVVTFKLGKELKDFSVQEPTGPTHPPTSTPSYPSSSTKEGAAGSSVEQSSFLPPSAESGGE